MSFLRKLLVGPLPVTNLGEVETVLCDVLLMSNESIHHLLIEVASLVSETGKSLDHIENKVITVDLVLNSHIERSGDSTLFVVAAYEQVAVLTMIEKLMYKGRIAVECEDYRLVLGEQCVEVSIRKTVRMLGLRLELEQVNNVDESDLDLRQVLTHDGNSSESLESRGITAASENNVRLFALVVGSPLPDAYTLCAVLNSLLHGEPLGTGMLGSYHNVYIVL